MTPRALPICGFAIAVLAGASSIAIPALLRAADAVRPNDQLAQSDVQNATYIGNIGGAQAVAYVSYEPLRDYAVFSGEIRSNQLVYTFTAEIVGNAGYGNMLDHQTGERFRIGISELSPAGFVLTANPFEGTTQTSYYFQRSQ